MTRAIPANKLALSINEAYPGKAIDWNDTDVWIDPEDLPTVARLLKKETGMDLATLTSISAVDYVEYFELIYHLLSMRKNQRAVVKIRTYGREKPIIPSVTDIWQGANLQEREIWDLMGIHFEGHPNMKRILLWEGFAGHPLRKDFLR